MIDCYKDNLNLIIVLNKATTITAISFMYINKI